MRKTVFISYCHQDIERVSLFASIIAKNNFDIWMDTKDIPLGESIISTVSKALNDADIYMLFISNNSIKSSWVSEELNIALSKNITNKKPQIIPVLLDDCSIPTALSGRLFLDARESIHNALSELDKKFQTNKKDKNKADKSLLKPVLSSVMFGLSKQTDISIGGYVCDNFSKQDLIDNRERIQKLLRKRANGILMNFVPLSDFDLKSAVPKYKNGVYDESIEQIAGSIESSICEKITAYATVFNPDIRKIDELVKNKLDKLYVTSLTYIFSVPFQDENFDKDCMQRIQDNYSIISYDFEEGATIEYDSNFFVSIKCTTEQIKLKLKTEYDFSFSKKAVAFSPLNFIEWLMDIEH